MKQKIAEFIRREFLQNNPEIVLCDDTDLLISGLLDSLGVMRLVAFLESESGVSIPPEDVTIDHFRDIRTIAEYMARRSGREAGMLP